MYRMNCDSFLLICQPGFSSIDFNWYAIFGKSNFAAIDLSKQIQQ